MLFSLKLFGGACLGSEDGPLGGPAAQRHRLALLALVAATYPGGVSREKLTAYLWPERNAGHARNLLKQAVHALRRVLGEGVIRSAGEELRLDPRVVQVDLIAFKAALAAGDPKRAVELYCGPFLDGFFLSAAPQFERWAERERERLASAYGKALETLAEAADTERDFGRAVEWWKVRAAHDPYDSRVALRLMQALEASGNHAGALQHAAVHQRLLQEELGIEMPPEVQALAERLRSEPAFPPALAGERHEPDPHTRAATRSPAGTSDLFPADPSFSPPASPAARTVRRHTTWQAAALVAVVLLGLATAPGLGRLLRPSQPRPDAPARAAPSSTRALAVLPCTNLSRDPEEEYFSDGLTEELIGTLSRVGALRVVARTSAFAFKGRDQDVREIGRALNVGTVLECSVRRDGDHVRVTAQLINAADGFHLWSEVYQREGTDVFAIQRDLTLQIVRALEAELTPKEQARLARRPTTSPEAHALYLKGRYFWNQRTAAAFTRAIEYFEQAIALDPQYAAAYAGLAYVYSLQGLSGNLTPQEAGERTRAAALAAIELDDGLAEAHTVLGGYFHVYAWDSEAAEREHLRAIELDPGYPTAHHWYSNFLGATGRVGEAITRLSTAVELDPLTPVYSEALAWNLMRVGQLEAARERLHHALELDSTYWRAHAVLGDLHVMTGSLEDAMRSHKRAVELAGANPNAWARLARTLALAGSVDDARRMLAELQAEARRTAIHAPTVATVFAALNDVEGAIGWLEQSYRQRHPQLRLIAGVPGFARLRDDPRFVDLLRRIGLPQ